MPDRDPTSGPDVPADSQGLKGDALVMAACLTAAAVLGFCLWLWSSLGSKGPGGTSDLASRDAPLASLFVGDSSCSDCHPGETASHARSGHSRTLRPAAQAGEALALDGRTFHDNEQDADWRFALRGNSLVASRKAQGELSQFIMEYAFGSGRHATTFVSLTDRNPERPSSLEHRVSYFAASDALDVTPGQDASTTVDPHELSPSGRNLGPGKTLECFGCHATLLRAEGDQALDARTMVPNVTCERCHGPARAHVEAARQGRKGPPMPFGLRGSSADLQMRHCGFCHRHPDMAPPGEIHPDNPGLARFQPVGLLQSSCYKKSPGGLPCTACHDPHARASTDAEGYEAACLSCHGEAPQTSCPVSPARGCVPCHMPARDSGQNISFHDHWIRIPAKASP
ncbi:MAG: multiheme c-type cytochrome [Isosphaeraceae bacterium]